MLNQLLALGATITLGHVDINGRYLGSLMKDGDILVDPNAEEYIRELLSPRPEVVLEQPKPRAKRKAAEPVEVPVADDMPDLAAAADE